LHQMGRYDDCIKDLESALVKNENDTLVLYLMGLAYFAHKKYKKCIKTLKRTLKAKPF